MHITWLFGNGLDIGFGLKTRYLDFYKYLETKSNDDNLIMKRIKEDKDNGDIYEKWADYEIKLGDITKDFNAEKREQLIEDKLEIDDYLNDYLKSIDESIDLSNIDAINIMKEALPDIINDKKEYEAKKVISLLDKNINSNFVFNAISFNYTRTVSLLWNNYKNGLANLKINGCPNQGYSCMFNKPFYLHGTVYNHEMIIGVNDDTQITNEEFAKDENFKNAFLKRETLKIAGQGNYDKFKKIISSSNIICTYGLSLGRMDQCYWEIIKEHLINFDALLIIYIYDKNYVEKGIIKEDNYKKSIKLNFYNSCNATEDEINKIKDKILVEPNHNIFEYSKNELVTC